MEKIYILESKGKRDDDKTFAKAKALRKYDKNQKLVHSSKFKKIITGIVTEKNGKLYIYTSSNFEKEYDDIYRYWSIFSL